MISKKLKKLHRGFTLVETLVAVLLLVTAIAGPLTIASRSLNAALVAKDQVTAFYLAQDALEHVRFVRDSNCLAAFAADTSVPCPAANWLSSPTSLASCIGAGASCSINTITSSIQACIHLPASTCDELYYNTTLKQFSHTGPASATNIKTLFKRVIAITSPVTGSSATEALVTVSVYWRDGISPERSVIVKEYISNWQ